MFRYSTAKLREGVTRIGDGVVNEFLIEGKEKAVLFDTGIDLFNIKDFPGHTPGSITLLDPALRFIYAGDASDIDIWMFTNPDCSLHEYAEAGRRYFEEVQALGYKKYRGGHMPVTHDISFMRDYAEWIDRLTPEKALIRCSVPGARSKLCFAAAPSAKHILFTSIYWAHQCEARVPVPAAD